MPPRTLVLHTIDLRLTRVRRDPLASRDEATSERGEFVHADNHVCRHLSALARQRADRVVQSGRIGTRESPSVVDVDLSVRTHAVAPGHAAGRRCRLTSAPVTYKPDAEGLRRATNSS